MDSWLDEWMAQSKIFVPICLYCLKWTKFGLLILRKFSKIVVTIWGQAAGYQPRPQAGG